jgi:transposase
LSLKIELSSLTKEELIEKYLELNDKYEKLKQRSEKKIVNSIDKIEKQDDKIEKLENELKKYKNAHTPSSQKKFAKIEAQGLKVGRKKGKKSGHKGKTRVEDIPQKIIEVTAHVNPGTGNKNIKPTGHVEIRTVTDFEIVKIVRQYNLHEYVDLDTGELFLATHKDLPERGIFGKNVLAFASYLRSECQVKYNKIASIFTNVFDISMSTPTAMDICNRVAEHLRPNYDELKEKIKTEKAVNIDETGAKRNGLPGWLWGFFSLYIALYVFNSKRGGDILERTLGNDFLGKIGADGWGSYKKFCEEFGILLQRCWAHPIREVKDICIDENKRKDKNLIAAYNWYRDIFSKVKEARKIKCREIREQLYIELIDELDMWIKTYLHNRKLHDVVSKIKNGREYWFTCVLYLEIEPTNNLAERMLRAWVVFRKTICCLRSEQGERTTETMLSLFNTWKLNGLQPYAQLKSVLGA